jgi:hypothetical protein
MILLALSALIGTSKLMSPYLGGLAGRNDTERFQYLASNLLFTTGMPSNWGQAKNSVLSNLGLAKAGSILPYELDVDKVTRLNNENIYSMTYPTLWQAFGVKDASFQIEIRTLFELSINLVSNSTQGSQTIYEFEIITQKSGMPIPTSLSGYTVVKDFVNRTESSISSSGEGRVWISIPNSVNGTALLLVFARSNASPQIVSFSTYAFVHNSQSSLPTETFVRLSPLDHVLNASFAYVASEVIKAQVFTFNYNFSLTEKAQGVQTVEYIIPRLLDASPMVTVLTGANGSASFAEWAAYPQIPLQMGANFNETDAGSRIAVYSQIVTIGSALYEVVTKWGGLSNGV